MQLRCCSWRRVPPTRCQASRRCGRSAQPSSPPTQALGLTGAAGAQDLKKRKLKVPEDAYTEGPDGLKCASAVLACSCSLCTPFPQV